jgi:hypothetical protein
MCEKKFLPCHAVQLHRFLRVLLSVWFAFPKVSLQINRRGIKNIDGGFYLDSLYSPAQKSRRRLAVCHEDAIEIADFSKLKFEAIKAPASANRWPKR